MSDPDAALCFSSARDLRDRMANGELSALHVLEAHLRRIDRVNPELNAIVTLVPEAARERARSLDDALARGAAAGPLHGLPVAIKDLQPTRGIRTTFGSRIYADYVPEASALFVERLEAAGAVVVGKTNTPELGAGSQTFNEVFGRTRNPYDLSKTCGGSSGGAAVALATGMVALADGSDLGGSLRNPASFCNVVGLRPSPGRVPRFPAANPWSTLDVLGPMGRGVEDLALLLSVMAGPDARDPLSIAEAGAPFAEIPEGELRGARAAFSPDLGGLPVEREVLEALERALPAFEELGVVVERADPDFEGAGEIFHVLRAQAFAAAHARELERHRDLMKDTVIWNVEQGLALTGPEIAAAEIARGTLYHRFREFLERHEFLLLPVTQVLPFDLETDWVREIEGTRLSTYIDWMKSCSFISLTGHPALSVPAGFSSTGLPVGLQIVGRYREEHRLLRLARAFERATRFGERRPGASGNSLDSQA